MFLFRSKKIYVPIGIDCDVAYYLRSINLRREAFPFDWIVSPISSSIELINNDFEGFLEFSNLSFLEPTKRFLFKDNELCEDMVTPVYCKRYHQLFVHDFSARGINDYTQVFDKYKKRVNRLRELLYNKEKIVFVYNDTTPNSWQLHKYNRVNYTWQGFSEKNVNINYKIISFRRFKRATYLRSCFYKLRDLIKVE
ncbi:DUF1796 family putative cysteine peptidase [Francisella sp. XLW-1]|uniref:DUF1796 family putative cysteine peptidase n=1 Tax=Francisella sp. XLW-1 TaxID=2610887 RepID=UPI00123D7544|nr:DUF1796 family putative cysteine peptidase [Francisella sp. XLW-1]